MGYIVIIGIYIYQYIILIRLTDCTELDLYVSLKPKENVFYTCEVIGRHTVNVRYPSNGTISWFQCCDNQTFLYYVQDESEIVVLPTEPPTIFSAESLRNIGYGTLTGLLMFAIIVIICWFLRERSEKAKIAAKEAEQSERAKLRKEHKDVDKM